MSSETRQDNDFVELFAGDAEVSKHLRQELALVSFKCNIAYYVIVVSIVIIAYYVIVSYVNSDLQS